MYKKLYAALKDLISSSPKNFVVLCLLLLIETVILVFSVVAILPLADFILDSELKNPSRFTVKILEIFEFFNIDVSFFLLSSIFILAICLKGLFLVLINYYVLKLKYSIIKNLADTTMNSILSARWEFFGNTNQGLLTNTFTKEIEKIGNAIGSLARSFSQVLQFLIYLLIPFILSPKLATIIFVIIIVTVIPIVKILNPISYKFGKENTQTANKMMSVFSEVLQAAKIIISYGKKDKFRKNYLSSFDNHMTATIKNQMLGFSLNSFFQPFGILIVLIVIGISLSGGIELSELAAIFYSLISSITLLNNLMGVNLVINNFLPSYEQLNDIKNKSKNYEETKGHQKFLGINKKIELININFNYSNRSLVLKKINFKLEKNKFYALVGQSGAGKSTISDLLLGLLKPTQGKILIDGQNLTQFNLDTYRQKISYVPQESILFNDNIKNNLDWVRDDIVNDKEIWDILEFASSKNFINELPDKLLTKVGDRGVKLSGGQIQRLALARAFLRKPELLILDEATSSLDSTTEKLVQKSMDQYQQNYNTTLFVIAHRLATIKKADQVFVLKKGEIIEAGTFKELNEKVDSELKKMVSNQSFLENE